MARPSTRGERTIEAALVLALPPGGAALVAWAAMMVGRPRAPAVLAAGLASVALVAWWALRIRFEVNHYGRLPWRERMAKPWRKRLRLVAAALVLVVAGAWVGAPAPLTSLDSAALERGMHQDAALLQAHAKGLDAAMAQLEREHVPPDNDEALSAKQEQLLLDTWGALLDYSVALESLRRFYEDYYRFDLDRRRDDHITAFLLTFTAGATLNDVATRFSARVKKNRNAARLLNVKRSGIAENSFSRFRQRFFSYDEQLRLEAGRRYLTVIAKLPSKPVRAALNRQLRQQLDSRLSSIDQIGIAERVKSSSRAELQHAKNTAKAIWYPLQKGVAEMLGDARVRRIGRYLIDKKMRDQAELLLQPGDILLSRKNWYLSNVGLPGFWPHAIVYLGESQTLTSYFNTPEVAAWAGQRAKRRLTFVQYLMLAYPEAWQHYTASHDGEPAVVIEAVSEGVVFTAFSHCAGDYLAGLRPRLSKLNKAKAVARAFAQFNKPYDFDFDFATDDALVCTELVYRAYQPRDGVAGLSFVLRDMAGRTTLPANDIAAQFANQRGSDQQQLDFVLFVDAREKDQRAFMSNEEAFAASHLRPKWDIVQE